MNQLQLIAIKKRVPLGKLQNDKHKIERKIHKQFEAFSQSSEVDSFASDVAQKLKKSPRGSNRKVEISILEGKK